MTWIAATLWDLISPNRDRASGGPAERPEAPAPPRIARIPLPRRLPMQERYDALVIEMKSLHGIRVRKWRRSSSGVAWEARYRDGRIVRYIAAPYPRGPMSCAIFLHEVGHHAIGLGVYRPRCLEEFVAWQWALREMRARGFAVTPSVEKRVRESLRYAVEKARRRGLRDLPPELAAFAPAGREQPVRRTRQALTR
jgi:hypothetical protein